MRIAIYSPYLDTFGGGERYMMTIGETFSAGNTVDVLLDRHLHRTGGDYLKDELSVRFNLNLDPVNFISAPVGEGSNVLERLFFIKNYDVLVYLTDGSIFFPSAKRNILHIQSPLAGEVNGLWRKIKLKRWDLIIYNSKFTKEHSKKNWPVKSEIIYPPVDITAIKPLKKEKYILSVGRFFGYLKDKKHEVLLKVFRELFKAGKINGWSLYLVGSCGEGDEDYLEQLKKLAKDLPVKFYPNLEYRKLIELYGKSSIYWHASGFEETDPTKMEHFGISTVEAMAGGCVPVVIKKGGQVEIIESRNSGFLWESLEEFKDLTLKLISNQSLQDKMSKNAIMEAKNFSKKRFEEGILKLL